LRSALFDQLIYEFIAVSKTVNAVFWLERHHGICGCRDALGPKALPRQALNQGV
jgi:hypothetical protein